jgi:hypothetical protein
MSMRAVGLGLGLVLALALEQEAHARNKLLDVLGWPFRFAGGEVASAAADKFKPALKEVVGDLEHSVDRTLDKHEQKVANLARGLLDDVNFKLEDRILQVKTSANEVIDHAFDRVDLTLREGLVQAERTGTVLIRQAGKEVRATLDHTDGILRERLADVDRMATTLVVRTDEALAARIEQVDELAGRRLGNVDVIASKQRIALERTVVRVAVLIGLVVFAVFALRRLHDRYTALQQKGLTGMRGAPRTWAIVRGLGPVLGTHLAGAALGAGVLLGLYQVLPLGAAREAEELLARHEQGLAQATAQFDHVQARFHAAQLEFLSTGDAGRYRAIAAKAELLRDLVARPTLLASREGLATLAKRVDRVEQLFGGRADPDALVLRALLLWETGQSRRHEHEAASLAGRALRLAPGGFALAPLARAYVDTFLETPYEDGEAGVGRDATSAAELRDVLAASARDRVTTPLDTTLEVARLIRRLDRESSRAYVAMVRAHARLSARPGQRAALLAERNQHARAVVAAWTTFDAALSALGEDPAVLAAFRLNDAVLTRALWFVVQPQELRLAPTLAELTAENQATLKVRMAPARVGWARRYRELLHGPARDLAEFHEAERFRAWEVWTQEFEEAMVAHERALATRQGEAAARWRAVVAAAALGLYVETAPDGTRAPLAQELAGDLRASPRPPTAQDRAAGLPATLAEALRRRGPRLL